MSEKNWYVVYTRPRCEKRATALLKAMGIEVFCFPGKGPGAWPTGRKSPLRPIFHNYIFIRIRADQQESVKQTEGVLDYVYWLDRPAIVATEEIQAIDFLCVKNDAILFEKIAITPAKRLRNINEPFVRWIGTLQALQKGKALVQLPTLGFRVEIDISMQPLNVIPFVNPTVRIARGTEINPVEANTAS